MQTAHGKQIFDFKDPAEAVGIGSRLSLSPEAVDRGYEAVGVDNFGNVIQNFYGHGTEIVADVYNYWDAELPNERGQVWDALSTKHYTGDEYISIINNKNRKATSGAQWKRIQELRQATDKFHLTQTQHHLKSASAEFEIESGETRRISLFSTGNNSFGAVNVGLSKAAQTEDLNRFIRAGRGISEEFNAHILRPIKQTIMPDHHWNKANLSQANLTIVINSPSIQSELEGIRQSIATKGFAYSTESFLMGGPGGDAVSTMLQDINTAQKAIDVMSPYLDKPEVVNALIAAQERGINVRVMSTNPRSGVATATGGGAGHDIALARLQAAGVSVYTPGMYDAFLPHLKGYRVDDRVGAAGSHNITGNAERASFDGFFRRDDSDYMANFIQKQFDSVTNRGYVKKVGAGRSGYDVIPRAVQDYAYAEKYNFGQGVENPEFIALGIDFTRSRKARDHRSYMLLPSRAGSSYHFGVALHNNLMRQAGYHHMVLGERREGIATQMYRAASTLNAHQPASSAGMYWAARYDQGLYAQGLGNYLNEHLFMPAGWGRVYKDEVGALPSFLGMIGKAFDTGYMYYNAVAPDMAMIGQDYSEDAVGYNMLAGGQVGMFERLFEGAAYNTLQAAAAVSLYVTVGQPLALIQAEFMKDNFIGAVKASFQGAGAQATHGKMFNAMSAFNLYGDLSPWMRPGEMSGQAVKEAVMRKAAAVEANRSFYSMDNERLGFVHYQQYIARGRAGYLLERTMKPILVDVINPHTAGSVGSELFIEKVDNLIKAIQDPIELNFKLVSPYTDANNKKIYSLKNAVKVYEADVAADWANYGKKIEAAQGKLLSLRESGLSEMDQAVKDTVKEIEDLKTVRTANYSARTHSFREAVERATVSVSNIGADRSEYIAKKLQDVLYEVPINPLRWGIFGGHRGQDYMRVGQIFSFYELTQHAKKVVIGRGSFSKLVQRAQVFVGDGSLDPKTSVRDLRKSVTQQIRKTRMFTDNFSRMTVSGIWQAITTEIKSSDGTVKRVMFDLEAKDKAWSAVKKGDIKTAIKHAKQFIMPVSRIGQTTATMRDAERAMLKANAIQLDERGGIIMLSADEATGSHMKWLNAIGEYQDQMAKQALTADELYRVGQASVDFRAEKIMAGIRKGSHGVMDNAIRMRQRTLGLLAAGAMFGTLVLNNIFQSNRGTSLWSQVMMATVAADESKSISVDFSGNRLLPTEVIAHHTGMDMLTVNTAWEVASGVGFFALGTYLARNASYTGFQPYEFAEDIIEDVSKRQLQMFKSKVFPDGRLYYYEKALEAADAQVPSKGIDTSMPKDADGNPVKGGKSRVQTDYDSAAKAGRPDYERMWTLNVEKGDIAAAEAAASRLGRDVEFDDLMEVVLKKNLALTDAELAAARASSEYDSLLRKVAYRTHADAAMNAKYRAASARAVSIHKVERVAADGAVTNFYRVKGMMQTYTGKNAMHALIYGSVLILASQGLRSSIAATLDTTRETAGAADPLVAAGIMGIASGVMTRNIAVGAIVGIFSAGVTGLINKWSGFRVMPLGGAGKKLETASAQMNASLQNYAMAVRDRGKYASEVELMAAFYAKELSRQKSIFENTRGNYVQSIARQVPLPFIQLAFVERSRGFGFKRDGGMTFESEFVEKNYAVALQAAPITGFSFSVALPVKYNRNGGVMGWSYDDSGDVNILDIAMGSARIGAVQALTIGMAAMFTGSMGRLLTTSKMPHMKMLSPLGETFKEASKALSFMDNMGKYVTKFLNEFIVSNALQVAKHVPTSVLALGLRISDNVTTTVAAKTGSHKIAKSMEQANVDERAGKYIGDLSTKFRGGMSRAVFGNLRTIIAGGVIGYTAVQFLYQGYLEQINERQDEQDPLVNFAVASVGVAGGIAGMGAARWTGMSISGMLETRTNIKMIKYRYGSTRLDRFMRGIGVAKKTRFSGLQRFIRSGAGSYTRTLGLALAVSYLVTNQDFGLTVAMDRSYRMHPNGDPAIDPQTGEVLYERLPAHQMLVAGLTATTFAGVMSLFGGMGRSNASTLQRYAQLLVTQHGLQAEHFDPRLAGGADVTALLSGPRNWINRLVNFVQAPGIEEDGKLLLKTMNNEFQKLGDSHNPKKYQVDVADDVLKEIDDMGLSAADTAAAKHQLRTNQGKKAVQVMRTNIYSGQVEAVYGFDSGKYATMSADEAVLQKKAVASVATSMHRMARLGIVQKAAPLNRIVGARMFSKRMYRGVKAAAIAQITFNVLATAGHTDYTFIDDMLRGFDSHGKFRLGRNNQNLDPRGAIGDFLRLILQIDRHDMKAVEIMTFGRPQNKIIATQKNLMASRKDIKSLQKNFRDMRDMMIFDDPNAFMSIMGMGGVTFRSGDKGPRINFYFQLQNAGQDISTSVYSMSSAFGFNAMLAGAIEHNLITEYALKGLTAGHMQPHQLAVMGTKLLQSTGMIKPLKSSQRRRVSSMTQDELHVIQKDPLHAMIVKDREKAFANMSWQPTPSLFSNMLRGDVDSRPVVMQRILQSVVSNRVVATDGTVGKALNPNSRNQLISFLLRSKGITGNQFQMTNITNALIYSNKRRAKGRRAESVDMNTDTVWTDFSSMATADYDFELQPANAITEAVSKFRQYLLEPLKPVPILNTLVYNPVAQMVALSAVGVGLLGVSLQFMQRLQVLEDQHELNRAAAMTFDENFLEEGFVSKKYKVASTPSAVRAYKKTTGAKIVITKGEMRFEMSEFIDEASALHTANKTKGVDPVNSVISGIERAEQRLNKVFTITKDLSETDIGKGLSGLKSKQVTRSLFGMVDDVAKGAEGGNLVNYIYEKLFEANDGVTRKTAVLVDDFQKVVTDSLFEQIERAADEFLDIDFWKTQKIMVDGEEHFLINLLDRNYKGNLKGGGTGDEAVNAMQKILKDLEGTWKGQMKPEIEFALREALVDQAKLGTELALDSKFAAKFAGGDFVDQLNVVIKDTLGRLSESSVIQSLKTTLGGLLQAEDIGSLNYAQKQIYKMVGVLDNFEIPGASGVGKAVGKQVTSAARTVAGAASGKTTGFKPSSLRSSAWGSVGQAFKGFALAMDVAWAFDTFGAFANLSASYTDPYSTQLDIDMQEKEVGMIAMNAIFGLTVGMLGFKYLIGGGTAIITALGFWTLPVIGLIAGSAYMARKPLGQLWNWTTQQAKTKKVGEGFNSAMWAGGDFLGSALGAPGRTAYHLTGSERAASATVGATGGAAAGLIMGMGMMQILTTGGAALTAATGAAAASIPFWPVIGAAVAVGAIAGGILMATAPQTVSNFTTNVRRSLFNLHPMLGPWLANNPYEVIRMQSRFRKNLTNSPFDFGWARTVAKEKYRMRLAAAKDYTGKALASQSLDNYIFGDSGPTSAFKEFVAKQSWSIARPTSAVDDFIMNELKIREQIVSHSTFGKAGWEAAVGRTGQEKRLKAREKQWKKKKLQQFLKAERDAQRRTTAQAEGPNTGSNVDAFAFTQVDSSDVALVSSLVKTIESVQRQTSDSVTEVEVVIPNITTQPSNKTEKHVLDTINETTGRQLQQFQAVEVSYAIDGEETYFKVDPKTSDVNVLLSDQINDMISANSINQLGYIMQHQSFEAAKIKVTGASSFAA